MLFKRGVKARRPRLDLRGAHHRLTRVGGVGHLPADQADERAAPRPVDDAGAARIRALRRGPVAEIASH